MLVLDGGRVGRSERGLVVALVIKLVVSFDLLVVLETPLVVVGGAFGGGAERFIGVSHGVISISLVVWLRFSPFQRRTMLISSQGLSRSLKLFLLSLVLNIILVLNMRVQLRVKSLELVLSLLLNLKHPSLILPLLLQLNLLKLPLQRPLELVQLCLLHSSDPIFCFHHQSLEVLLLSDVLLLCSNHMVAVVEVLLLLLDLLVEGVYLDLLKSPSLLLGGSELHELELEVFLMCEGSYPVLLIFLEIDGFLQLVFFCLELKQLLSVSFFEVHLLSLN